MPSIPPRPPKGNQYAKGNKSNNKYKPEYAEIAQKLCAMCGFVDMQLADWFDVCIDTIYKWKLAHPKFAEALKVGKAETDELVERGTVAGIMGYYVEVDELDKFGVKHRLQKWIPGNSHAGMKWLAARKPKEYREQKDVHHSLNMDDAFLRFLDAMDDEQKTIKAQQSAMTAPRPMLSIIDAEVVEVETHKSDGGDNG